MNPRPHLHGRTSGEVREVITPREDRIDEVSHGDSRVIFDLAEEQDKDQSQGEAHLGKCEEECFKVTVPECCAAVRVHDFHHGSSKEMVTAL